MAEIPHSWEAYASLQQKLIATTCITMSDALESALNVIHSADFRPEDVSNAVLEKLANSESRRARRRARIVRMHFGQQAEEVAIGPDSDVGQAEGCPPSLDDQVHAQRELIRLEAAMCEPDWALLTDVAFGSSYEELAIEHTGSASALRSRVCRLRRAIG